MNWLGWTIGVVTLGIWIWIYIDVVRPYMKERRKQEKDKEMEPIKKTIKLNIETVVWRPPFTTNRKGGVLAVCLTKDFHFCLDEYLKKAEEGREGISDLKKIVVRVPSTFTFWENVSSARPIHCGNAEEFDKILTEVVGKLVGLEAYDMKNERASERVQYLLEFLQKSIISFWKVNVNHTFALEKALCIEDARLFVPYSDDKANLEEQKKIFGRKTLQKATECLLNFIPVLKIWPQRKQPG